ACRALRARAAAPGNSSRGGLDQRADKNSSRECPKNDDRHSGRPAAWGPRTATGGESTHRNRQQRGGASLNAEPGCLKVVDAARGDVHQAVSAIAMNGDTKR